MPPRGPSGSRGVCSATAPAAQGADKEEPGWEGQPGGEAAPSALPARLSPPYRSLRATSSAASQSCHQGVTLPSLPHPQRLALLFWQPPAPQGRPRTGCSGTSLLTCQEASRSWEEGAGESWGQETASHFRAEEGQVSAPPSKCPLPALPSLGGGTWSIVSPTGK